MSKAPEKSKVSVLVGYGQPHVLEEVSIPEVGDGEILVEVLLAGLCGTDIHQHLGSLGVKTPLPVLQGHETIGRIVKLGKDRVKDISGAILQVGDRILWSHSFCGECYHCKVARKPSHCSNIYLYGYHDPCKLHGGFAEYEVVIPTADVVKVPEQLTDEEVIGVGCAFRTVIAGFEKLNRHSSIGLGETVVIQGCGPIGLYSCVSAAQSGAGKVIVIGGPAERLDLAKKWGATEVINIDEVKNHADRVARIMEITEGRGAEVVIECSGYPPAFIEGFDFLMTGGTFLVLGQTSSKTIDFNPYRILEKRAIVLGSANADITHFYKAIQFIQAFRHKYPFAEIVSAKYPLEEVDTALKNMREGKDIKAVIDNRKS